MKKIFIIGSLAFTFAAMTIYSYTSYKVNQSPTLFTRFIGALGASDNATNPALVEGEIIIAQNDTFTIKKAVSHENLQVFMLEGKARNEARKYLTLDEAIQKQYVTVKETGDVNQLSVNNSSDVYVYINSGDIVKGGKQDRTLGQDVIIPPKSGDMPLESFCVESGRWRKRGNETSSQFGSSSTSLSSRKLKIAAKYNKNQSEVWSNVSDQQQKLNENISRIYKDNIDIRSEESASSLQLSLENEDLQKTTEKYKQGFFGIIENNKDLLGFAYAINGEVYGIDIYNSPELFQNNWPKLLDAIIVEALTDQDTINNTERAKVEDIVSLITKADESEKQEEQHINETTKVRSKKDGSALVFETFDDNKWVHKNYLREDTLSLNSKPSGNNQLNNSNEYQQRIIINEDNYQLNSD